MHPADELSAWILQHTGHLRASGQLTAAQRLLKEVQEAKEKKAAPSRLGNGYKPILAITMGDPCGVGPEIIVKTFMEEEVIAQNRLIVVGAPEWIRQGIAAIPDCNLRVVKVSNPEEALFEPGTIECYAPFEYDMAAMKQGVVCPEGGRCAAMWVIEAVKLAMANRVDGIVTAPLNKEAMHKAGFKYGGHTELLAEHSGVSTSRLCLASGPLNVVHATCHVPFDDITKKLEQPGQIMETVELAHEFMVSQGVAEPHIALCGLNPHCEPIFGDQETRIIQPVIDEARAKGLKVFARPIPPDTIFMRQIETREFDIIIAMYHDQGHIPAKISGFGDTVNVTLGLPIVRTSVDHGTAFDIAGKGLASHSNMISAVDLGARMACGRREERIKGGSAGSCQDPSLQAGKSKL